jgi:cytosine deaminase
MRATEAVRRSVRNGITAIRTHADLHEHHGLRSVEALLEVKHRVADVADLQVACLVGWPLLGSDGAAHRALLAAAIAAGIDVVGGCPHLDENPIDTMAALLDAAGEAGLPVDLHTDETLNPAMLNLVDLAARVRATGFRQHVTASHCVSLGVQSPTRQREVAAEVADAGIAVVALPQTNLFLQGRDTPIATPRGLTALRPLLDAGVTLAAGADNLQDPFNTMGRADPFETAALLVMAGHLTPDEAFDAVTVASRQALGLPAVSVRVGSPAELLAVRSPTLRAAIADAPMDRIVVHRGRIVSATRVVHEP